MPTYEYRCQACGNKFEEFQTMSAAPVESCPKCNGKVQRIISGGTGLIFKGSGFYINDYKRKDSGSKEGNSESSTSAKPDAAKSESAKSEAAKPSSETPEK